MSVQPIKALRPRFSPYVYFYLGTFFLLLALLPIILTLANDRARVRPACWLLSLLWLPVLVILWRYADRRCSSERMRLDDGLLWITASMMTGWVYLSFIFVLPVLLLVFSGSVLIASYGDIRRLPDFSRTKWHGLVYFFYSNRLRP